MGSLRGPICVAHMQFLLFGPCAHGTVANFGQ